MGQKRNCEIILQYSVRFGRIWQHSAILGKIKWIAIIVAFSLFIFLISNSSSSSTTTENDSSATTVNSDYYPDEDIEPEQIEEDVDTNSDQLEFNGYPCTEDCSGHEAGYEWAEENGITQDDVDNYSGDSNSFMEGMQSYVDENE